MAERTSQDIKELKESLRALEKSLTAISQKQDSQFEELKKLILLNSRTSPRSTADSEPSVVQLSSSEVDTDSKTVEIPRFDGSSEDEDHEHHLAPNSTFIIEGAKLPPSPPTWKYDVFVSFRGKDTRRGFVSHLFQAFKREDINCYRDVDGNERGQKVDSMLIDAIHHSKMAIVLLSQNYADSKWCLQELVEILSWNKQHHIHGHVVLPIFYDVSSSDVRHLGGMVGKAFERCIAKNGQHNKDIWENALKQAGRISSWSSNNGDEAYLIQEIVEVLLERVAYSRSPLLLKSCIVPNDNLSHFRSMLDMTSNDVVRTVGICGPKGVGKTTLANAACVDLHKVFEGRVILLEDIHANATTEGLLQIQSKIAVELLKDKWFRLSEDTEKNFLEIQMRLSQKKVLVVFDNVTNFVEVEFILGEHYKKYLGLGSRVVIISWNWELLELHNVDDIYMVPPLNHEDSLKLFYHYAFMGRQEVNVIKRYEELSKNIVYYAAGMPSVLESLGYSLSKASETQWYEKLRDLVRSSHPGDTKVYQCGPFGRERWPDSRWDDGEHCDVRGIELVIVDSVIKSIGVTYDNYGHPVGPLFHGCSSSSSTVLPQKIELDYPYEYLMAISGYIGKTEASKVFVRSLTLHSNRRTLGPFGDDSKTGQHFYTNPTGAKIVGFFGSGDSELGCIGVHAKQVSHTYPHHQVVGPFGINTSSVANHWDHGAFTDIKKIIITQNDGYIISISCVYDNNGLPVEKLSLDSVSSRFKQVEVTLNYPTEFILSMSGCYEKDGDYSWSYVKSLTFRTNLKTYGPYGSEKGMRFSTPLELGKIIGFYGTYHHIVQSIGAYFAPAYHVHPLATIGPFGGVFSKTWDDGKHSGVKRIDIHHGHGTIHYMRFTYIDGNGGTVHGRELGFTGYDSGIKEVIMLDHPKEYLESISGWLGSYEPSSMPSETHVITSLSFETNLKKELGPYGSRSYQGDDKPFSFKSNIAKIVGFHGTLDTEGSGSFSVGPHLQLL